MKNCGHLNGFAVTRQVYVPGAKDSKGKPKRRTESVGRVCPDCRGFFPKAEVLDA